MSIGFKNICAPSDSDKLKDEAYTASEMLLNTVLSEDLLRRGTSPMEAWWQNLTQTADDPLNHSIHKWHRVLRLKTSAFAVSDIWIQCFPPAYERPSG